MVKPKLYFLGTPGDGYGWGVANTNLVAALRELCTVEIAPPARKRFDAPIFTPIAGNDLKPPVKYDAPRILGYCFTEWPLPDTVKRNARIYDVVFAGSTWNANQLRKAGVKHVETLLQGIDHTRFCPKPQSDRKGFVIFSGGKYEFRKAQDYVIAAVGTFMRQHSDVVLMAAWHNPWPQTMESMKASWLIDTNEPLKGIPADRFFELPPVPNEKTTELYAQAHIGLFPNRCEAGTNLVMCEFMACERPVIATYATGHKDVFRTDQKECQDCGASLYLIDDDCPHCHSTDVQPIEYPLLLKNGTYDPAGWFNPNVSDIIAHLEHAYQHRDQLPGLAAQCRAFTERLTWGACAKQIYSAAFGCLEQDRASQSQVLAYEPPMERQPG